MTADSDRTPDGLQRLSALMDGEDANATSIGQACCAWRDDATVRTKWHAWHVIGDVMRSDDLVRDAGRDAAFLAALRLRLEAEPVVLAPQPLPAAAVHPARRTWSGMAAVAAGLAVVVGAGLLMQPTQTTPQLASSVVAPTTVAESSSVAPPELRPVSVVSAPARTAEPQVLAADGELIRDARLDRYLAAHKPLGTNPALAVQSSFAGAVRSRAVER